MKLITTLVGGMRNIKQVGVLALLIIFIDQTVKLFVTDFSGNYYLNKGIAFGIFGKELSVGFLLNLIGVIFILLIIGKGRMEKPLLVPLVVLLGAGTSNLIDRVVRGGVVDYLDLGFIPSFNLADFLITTTSIILIALLFKENFKSKNATK